MFSGVLTPITPLHTEQGKPAQVFFPLRLTSISPPLSTIQQDHQGLAFHSFFHLPRIPLHIILLPGGNKPCNLLLLVGGLPICLFTNSIQEESQGNLELGIIRIKNNWVDIPKYNLITWVLKLKCYLIATTGDYVGKRNTCALLVRK